MILDEAIEKGLQVRFHYCKYGTDKKLHKQLRSDGSVREYVINPYQMAAREGKYYLICNFEGKPRITHYRIDRIDDISILDTPARRFEQVEGGPHEALDLAKYMAEHIYMFSSSNERVQFRIKSTMISDVIDLFGDNVFFYDERDGEVSASASADYMSMKQFALRYSPDVVILSPDTLANEVKDALRTALEKYGE